MKQIFTLFFFLNLISSRKSFIGKTFIQKTPLHHHKKSTTEILVLDRLFFMADSVTHNNNKDQFI